MCTLLTLTVSSVAYVSAIHSIFSMVEIGNFATFVIIYAKTIRCTCLIDLVLPGRIEIARLNFSNIILLFVSKYFLLYFIWRIVTVPLLDPAASFSVMGDLHV